MRKGKTLRRRLEELGFNNPVFDERVHDVLDALERARVVCEEAQADGDDRQWCVCADILEALKPR